MKNWDEHGYNDSVCSTWKEPEPDEEKTAAQANLEKWLFYFDRFNNHELSAKLDQELVERTAEKMLEIQQTGQLSWIEVSLGSVVVLVFVVVLRLTPFLCRDSPSSWKMPSKSLRRVASH